MDNKDISKMAREVRTALGLTQKQFAAKIGVACATVNRWENDKRRPCPLAMHQLEKLQKEIIEETKGEEL
jgi:transcriptional regulator with XRE-family HTH domain